jgi:exopolysaccharide biosynthesis polyprenyl glycosylphosphotransferase
MIESKLISELEATLDQEPVDEVFVSLPSEQYAHLTETIIEVCEEQGIIVRVDAAMFSLKVATWRSVELGGKPILTIQSGPSNEWHLITKRLIDIFGSALLLVVLAPISAIVALLIKLESRGPVFFTQVRIGFNKRRFGCFKFRTMTVGAHELQHTLEHLNEADGPVFKIKHDPRVTRIGRFLRRFSIDEFPQLFNVFKGDMSLVGPRPLPVRDFERINARWHKRRFSMKPGMTCLWQVNGRGDVGFDDWVEMDLEYIDKWSLALDTKILLRTIPAALRGTGAY